MKVKKVNNENLNKKNEMVRQLLNTFLIEKGVKMSWIAEQIEMSNTTVSYFKNNQRNLTDNKLNLILKIIN